MPRKPVEKSKTKSKSKNSNFVYGLLVASVFFIFILPQLSKKMSLSPGTANEGSSSQAGVGIEKAPSEPSSNVSSLTSLEQKTLKKAQGYFKHSKITGRYDRNLLEAEVHASTQPSASVSGTTTTIIGLILKYHRAKTLKSLAQTSMKNWTN